VTELAREKIVFNLQLPDLPVELIKLGFELLARAFNFGQRAQPPLL
jgi:hypothetical protein